MRHGLWVSDALIPYRVFIIADSARVGAVCAPPDDHPQPTFIHLVVTSLGSFSVKDTHLRGTREPSSCLNLGSGPITQCQHQPY